MQQQIGGGRIAVLPLGLIAVLALPFAEFAAFFWVAARIGAIPALLALIALSALGVFLLTRQGAKSIAALFEAVRAGAAPEKAARESLRVAAGGFLMILPGFLTGAIGLALLAPSLLRSLRSGSAVGTAGGEWPQARRPSKPRVVDLSADEWRPVDPPGPQR